VCPTAFLDRQLVGFLYLEIIWKSGPVVAMLEVVFHSSGKPVIEHHQEVDRRRRQLGVFRDRIDPRIAFLTHRIDS